MLGRRHHCQLVCHVSFSLFLSVSLSPFLPTEPHFLHAIEYGNYVYFFFSEIAVEYTTLGKVSSSSQTRHVPDLWLAVSVFQRPGIGMKYSLSLIVRTTC